MKKTGAVNLPGFGTYIRVISVISNSGMIVVMTMQVQNENSYASGSGDDGFPLWIHSPQKGGRACEYLCTLPEAVILSFPFTLHVRAKIVSQALPLWRTALSTHPEAIKVVMSGGKLKRLRAIPYEAAREFIEAIRPQIATQLNAELQELQMSIDALNNAAVAEDARDEDIDLDM